MKVAIFVLNYNGRELLPECLPSILREADASRHNCRVVVIDNESTDDGPEWLVANHPEVELRPLPNRGLCSFNTMMAEESSPVAILLNNDIRLCPGAIDPLIEPFERGKSDCFMTAPLCHQFDGETYEGFRTAVDWSYGLVRATARFPGNEAGRQSPDWTASVGAAMAVDREKFVELGGFDPIYLPGRIEDLDLAFRAFRAGWHIQYVPDSRMEHLGMATFGRAFGEVGCDRLALRNTLLFQWKNLRAPRHRFRQWLGLSIRLAADLIRAPRMPRERRFAMIRALSEAMAIWRRTERRTTTSDTDRELDFFRRFHPRRMSTVEQ